jgi:SMI1 / KNR4 family (SUKH-1)
MEFTDVGRPLTVQDLAALEEIVGELPEDLRQHYLQYNGGVPSAGYFTDDDDAENEIDSFLTTRYRQYPDEVLLEDYYQAVVHDRKEFSSDYVPFARNGGDDLYVMNRHDGSIYFWAHDVPGDPLRPVAVSLESLLNRMQTEAEYYGEEDEDEDE